MQETIRIIGIDPGLRNMGWGIIDSRGSSLTFVAAGTIQSNPKADLASRLCELFNGLDDIHKKYLPTEAAIEQTFVNKDAKATLKLGQARGVAMVVSANSGLSVAEYAPNSIKKSVIGVGHGDKNQVKMMVDMLLPKSQYDSVDAADALAIAICHAHNRGSAGLNIAASF